MKPLITLVKLNKNKLDNIAHQIKVVGSAKDNIISKLKYLEAEIQDEINHFFNTPYSYMLAQFLLQASKKKEVMSLQIVALDKKINLLQDELRSQFAELKKYEVALANKKQQLNQMAAISEIKQANEYNIIKYNFDKNN